MTCTTDWGPGPLVARLETRALRILRIHPEPAPGGSPRGLRDICQLVPEFGQAVFGLVCSGVLRRDGAAHYEGW